MTEIVDVDDPETQLSRLVERAAAGETVVIVKAGKPVARLVAATGGLGPRQPGLLRGLTVPDDMFTPLPPDELAAWE